MLYRHKPSGRIYRYLIEAFDVQEQRPSVVFISVESGGVFVRDKEIFEKKFEFVSNAQDSIVPTGPKAPLQEQIEMFDGTCS